MNFLTAHHTDVGTRKKTNQDSMLVMQAETGAGQVLLASVCDGMGGLAKGEVASATMVHALQKWFTERLPQLLYGGFDTEKLWQEWGDLVRDTSMRIMEYGRRIHIDLGTTCVALLIVGNNYYIMNVGDSRVYWFTDNIYQMTKDQTFVQQEIDLGKMTYEESLTHPSRSVLLQCIGASNGVRPVFCAGQAAADQVFMLCCDGFRHVITPQEFYQALNPGVVNEQNAMKRTLEELTRLNISRGEPDNISAILIRTY
jgi:serine/threonine protein phosphatase PrpC